MGSKTTLQTAYTCFFIAWNEVRQRLHQTHNTRRPHDSHDTHDAQLNEQAVFFLLISPPAKLWEGASVSDKCSSSGMDRCIASQRGGHLFAHCIIFCMCGKCAQAVPPGKPGNVCCSTVNPEAMHTPITMQGRNAKNIWPTYDHHLLC